MIYNQWYIILESRELKRRKPKQIKRLNETLALWRDTEGKVSCIHDQCCHRGASLSCGKLVNGEIECPFHGFLFNKEGKVTTIPSNGKNNVPPDYMKVHSYQTFEKWGLIWIWYGDSDKIDGEPFYFDDIKNYTYSSFKGNWNVHYSRAIENNLDITHLPFVHRSSIGSPRKTLLHGPFYKREGDHLTFYGLGVSDDGKTTAIEPNSIPGYENSHKLQFHFPHTWMVNSSKRTRIFTASIPVDEENTLFYFRYCQGWTKIPIIRKIATWIGMHVTRFIVNQDKKIVNTQIPRKSSLKMDEHLVAGDLPIVEYRKHRAYLQGKINDLVSPSSLPKEETALRNDNSALKNNSSGL